MNDLAVALVWYVVQVTLVATVASLVYLGVRRWGPELGSRLLVATLLCIPLLGVTMLSPWPNWQLVNARWTTTGDHRVPQNGRPTSASHEEVAGDKGVASTADGARRVTSSRDEDAAVAWRAFGQAFWTELEAMQQTPTGATTRPSWLWFVPTVVAAGMLVGLVRLVFGVICVSRLRKASVPIGDAKLNEQLDVVVAQLVCPRKIGLLECPHLVSPATIGWRRPLVLLPAQWRTWNDEERLAVLAHEVAHVRHHDYFTWFVAQVSVLPAFCHPLVHWLSRCLRLDQELLADAAAASVAGGRWVYVQSLAQLALRTDDRTLAWPARTFLPTRKTFLRRLEMLRSKHSSPRLAPPIVRGFAWMVVITTAIAALGLRGVSEPKVALAQKPPSAPVPTGAPAAGAGEGLQGGAGVGTGSALGGGGAIGIDPGQADRLRLSYIPRDAVAVIAARPQSLLGATADPEMIQMFETMAKKLQWDVRQIRDFYLVVLPPPAFDRGPAMIVKTASEADARAIFNLWQPSSEKFEYAGLTYYRCENRGAFVAQVEPETILYADSEPVIRLMLAAGTKGAERASWASTWHQQDGELKFVFQPMAMKAMWKNAPDPRFQMLAKVKSLTGRLKRTDQVTEQFLDLRVVAECLNPQDAASLRDTAEGSRVELQNALSATRQQIASSTIPNGPATIQLMDLADEWLEHVQLDTNQNYAVASVQGSAQEAIPMLVKTLFPASLAAREAAQQAHSSNNLKQLALAMHNYAATYGDFPPAVLYHANGTPRSWRIEMLPYLEEVTLYQAYRKDEPWDSEHNKTVLAKMPSVFRSPGGDENTKNSSYFVLTGEGTIFGRKEGTKFQEILDGTSNTILIVEAAREIPWTKPEDIPFIAQGDLPKLGGFRKDVFGVAMADGSVRALPINFDPAILRALIQMNDGQVISLDSLPR